MLEAPANELPEVTVRYSSKVVAIEESGFSKLIHLADGTTIKTKVLIGCDGVNSVVAKWLGFKKATFTGRSAVRGSAEFSSNHGIDHNFLQFLGKGFRAAAIPSDDKRIFWFLTWSPSSQDKELEQNPTTMKQVVLSKLENVPNQIRVAMEKLNLLALYHSR